MTALAPESRQTDVARRYPLRVRPDLVSARHGSRRGNTWVVKDPLALEYFHFRDAEYQLLQLADGTRSPEQIKAEFEARFPPRKVEIRAIHEFLGSLHRNGLLISDAPGQGQELESRDVSRQRRQRLAAWTNPLAIRFRGVDPQALLDALYPRCRWMFTPLAAVGAAVIVLVALLLVGMRFDALMARMPTFEQFFTPDQLPLLAAALVFTKVLHELGHALAARHFGGECHQVGVLLLIFTPCLYCDVSDSWMVPSKWRRAGIAAAGMYVELVLAALCTFLWWFTAPGLIHQLCLGVMFVGSVSTLAFNANPLLRYDGYYILADIWETPNLGQKASAACHRALAQVCLGLKLPADPNVPAANAPGLIAYGAASAVYRWLVAWAILLLVTAALRPYGLTIAAKFLGALALVGLVGRPLWSLFRFLRTPGRMDQVNQSRWWTTVLGVVLGAVLVTALPLPHRVWGTVQIEPAAAENVFVVAPGRLAELLVAEGQSVSAGQPLARLVNIELDLAIALLNAQQTQDRVRLESLYQRRFEDRSAGLQIAEVEKSLAAIETQIAEKEAERARLTLIAPRSGVVLPAPRVPEPADEMTDLPDWSGSLLERKNLGAQLTAGALLCRVGDPERSRATILIDQADVSFVRPGQAVKILLDAQDLPRLRGHVSELSRAAADAAPRQLSNKTGGRVVTRTDAMGVERPWVTSYQALVDLDEAPSVDLPAGLGGQARISTAWEPLAPRIARWFGATFQFQLHD